jgi:hypothetical protein
MSIKNKLAYRRLRRQVSLYRQEVEALPALTNGRYEKVARYGIVPSDSELTHLAQRYLDHQVDGGRKIEDSPEQLPSVDIREVGCLSTFEHAALHDWIMFAGDRRTLIIDEVTKLAGHAMQEDTFDDYLAAIRLNDDNPLQDLPAKLTERPVSEFEREQLRTSIESFIGTDYAWPDISDEELDGLVLDTRSLDRIEANDLMYRTHVLGEDVGRRQAITSDAWFGNPCNERVPSRASGMEL